MAEGPQVRRRTEWLHKHLADRKVVHCESTREDIDAILLTGKQIERAFCKGKHIFVEFDGGKFLHNHLLMRGTWKKLDGRLLFLPANAWLSLYLGPCTICNLGGQMPRLVERAQVDQQLAALGPDAMADPYPRDKIGKSLRSSTLPISEALLDQSLVAGIGNIAKSEILYSSGVDPRVTAGDLNDGQFGRLLDRIGLWTRERGLVFVTAWTTADPSFIRCSGEWVKIGRNSFRSDQGEVRTFLETGEIIRLFEGYTPLHHREALGPVHRHGNGPEERHARVEAVLQKQPEAG